DRARTARDRPAEGNALTGLGNLALVSGDLSHGLIYEEQALSIYRDVEDAAGELSVLNNLGLAYFHLGDLPQARSYMDLALANATKAKSREGEAQARGNRAVLLGAERSYAAALEEARNAGKIWQEVGNEREAARSRANGAEMLMRLGRNGEAAPAVSAALTAFTKSGDIDGQAYTQNQTGELRLAQGSPAGSKEAHRRALELAREVDSPLQSQRAHAGLSAALEASGDRAGALKEMLAALDEVEQVRTRLITQDLKARYFAMRLEPYERAIAL